jgi:hypothetical protein
MFKYFYSFEWTSWLSLFTKSIVSARLDLRSKHDSFECIAGQSICVASMLRRRRVYRHGADSAIETVWEPAQKPVAG